MATREPWNEQWQPFTTEICERSWGDLTQHTREIWKYFSVPSRLERAGCRSQHRSRPISGRLRQHWSYAPSDLTHDHRAAAESWRCQA